MEMIQQLLNRIHWDDKFGKGNFEVGIYDRFADPVVRHPLGKLHVEKGMLQDLDQVNMGECRARVMGLDPDGPER